MKTIKLYLVLTLIFLLFFAGCVVSVTVNDPVIPTAQPSLFKLIAAGIICAYEVVVRSIPSIGNYSVVSWFITALKFVSDKLNVSKNP